MRTPMCYTMILFLSLSAMTLSTGALAQDVSPEQLAEDTVTSVTELAIRFARKNRLTAERCVPLIEDLVESGDLREARHVARRCIGRIIERNDECVQRIERRCRRTARALTELGHPELADQVREVCEQQVCKVRRSQRRAMRAIREALPDDGPPDPA